MSPLHDELQRFRSWAESRETTVELYFPSEWECDYPHWPALYDAVKAMLGHPLSDVDVDDLLFAMARDSEDEVILDLLANSPAIALRVASRALCSPDAAARWQAAVAIGRGGASDAIELLRHFVSDINDYARRRALLALAPIDRPFAETVAIQWLSSSSDYSRALALATLQLVGSSQLEEALSAHGSDPSELVRTQVALLRAATSAEA